jgi:type IV pilus assembly protein PilW
MNNSSIRPIGNAPFDQRGLTLIEMAISMTIAMFLLAGITTVLMGVRTSFGTQNQLAQLQDNERLAMTIMTDVIQQAGYFPSPTFNTAASALPISATFAAAGQAITGTYNAAAPGDTITARFAMQNGDGIFNCAGASNGGAIAPYENKFRVVVAGGTSTLQCVPTVNNVAQAAVPLVSGVTNMVILYGVTTATGATSCAGADSYLTATQVTAIAAVNAWFNICSVSVSLFFTNPSGGNPIQFTRVIPVMSTAGP